MTWSLDVICALDRTLLEDMDQASEIKADPENMQHWKESKLSIRLPREATQRKIP